MRGKVARTLRRVCRTNPKTHCCDRDYESVPTNTVGFTGKTTINAKGEEEPEVILRHIIIGTDPTRHTYQAAKRQWSEGVDKK